MLGSKGDFTYLLDSFALIKPKKYEVLRTFYSEFFDEKPELRYLFLESTQRKQIDMLYNSLFKVIEASAVNYNDLSYFFDLGYRHASYNVSPQHLDVFISSLMKTSRCCGETL